MIKDLIPSLIRTWMPIVVGFIVSFLTMLGVNVTDDQKATLMVLLASIVSAVYYTVVRFLESKFPQLSWLLGYPTQPAKYTSDGKTLDFVPEGADGNDGH